MTKVMLPTKTCQTFSFAPSNEQNLQRKKNNFIESQISTECATYILTINNTEYSSRSSDKQEYHCFTLKISNS